MKNKLWSAVYDVFDTVHENRGAQQDAEELISLRERLRHKLEVLRSRLSESLTERENYFVLFPIVIYLDEIVQSRMRPGERVEWKRLQTELYGIDTGGTMFFDTLEDLLRKPDTYPFIYEVFYFCLSDGFAGRHKGSLVKLNEYKERLAKRVVLEPIETYREPVQEFEAIRFENFPFHYYVIMIVIFVGLYYGLRMAAQYDPIVTIQSSFSGSSE